jgi:hypothetical protein
VIGAGYGAPALVGPIVGAIGRVGGAPGPLPIPAPAF